MNDSSIETYDLRGLNCPLPVLKTRKRLSDMVAGARLWVVTSDPLAVLDVPHFCQEQGHSLLELQEVDGGHRFLIEKATNTQSI